MMFILLKRRLICQAMLLADLKPLSRACRMLVLTGGVFERSLREYPDNQVKSHTNMTDIERRMQVLHVGQTRSRNMLSSLSFTRYDLPSDFDTSMLPYLLWTLFLWTLFSSSSRWAFAYWTLWAAAWYAHRADVAKSLWSDWGAWTQLATLVGHVVDVVGLIVGLSNPFRSRNGGPTTDILYIAAQKLKSSNTKDIELTCDARGCRYDHCLLCAAWPPWGFSSTGTACNTTSGANGLVMESQRSCMFSSCFRHVQKKQFSLKVYL